MNALNKLSELWHTSLNRKVRPVVEPKDIFSFVTPLWTSLNNNKQGANLFK